MDKISESKVHAIAKYWAQKLAATGIKNIGVDADGNIVITYGDDTTSTISSDIWLDKASYDPTNSGKVVGAHDSEKLNGQIPSYYATFSDLNAIQSVHVQDYKNNAEIISTLSQIILDNHSLITKEDVEKKISDVNSNLNSLSVETETNNTTIHNVIKGDYLSTSNGDSIGLVKNINGVTIDMTMLTNQLNIINTQLSNLQTKDSQIIKGDFLNVDGGLSTTKTVNGVTIHGQDLNGYELKSNKNISNGYAGLDSTGKMFSSQFPIATTLVNGVVKIGDGLDITSDGLLSVKNIVNNGFITFPLADASTIFDTATQKYFRQRCSSKTDLRFNQTTTTITPTALLTTTTEFTPIYSSISDVGVWNGTFNGMVGISYLNQRSDTAGRWRINFYKRTSGGIETNIGTSSVIKASVGTNFDDIAFLTAFDNVTFTSTDVLVIRVEFSRDIIGITGTGYIGAEGPRASYTVFYMTSGGPMDIPMSSVQNLVQTFEGSYTISDLKLSGQSYKLNDFMTLSQPSTPANVIYVRIGGLNGDGSLFTPYSNINTAFNALSTIINTIEILDNEIYTIPIDTNGYLDTFIGNKCTTQGTLHLNRNNAFYHVRNHMGDIEIVGNNVTIVIDEELQGDIYVDGTNASIFVNKWNNTSFTIDSENNVADGSKIGRFVYGDIVRR